MAKNFYSLKEAAALLEVSLCTAYKYARIPREKGGPPAKRLGGKTIRFPKSAFRKWAGLDEEK